MWYNISEILYYITSNLGGIEMKKIMIVMLFFIFSINLSYAYNAIGTQEVRSAEFAVIEKCWGEGCAIQHVNIIDENFVDDKTFYIERLSTNYTFASRAYYLEDSECDFSTTFALLTDGNVNSFYYNYLKNELDQIVMYKSIKKNGKTIRVVDETATANVRNNVVRQFENFVNEVRSQYQKIEVILTDGSLKQIYVHSSFLGQVEKKVFALNEAENKLVAIKTDQYNNVFTKGFLSIKEVSISEKHYTVGEYFYLCESCSKCDDCDKLIAIGDDDDSVTMVYFSKFCEDHACLFVWNWAVDITNSGSKEEGLKCRERGDSILGYCYNHKCKLCENAIVGVSITDVQSNGDKRATGDKSEGKYSDYCVNHKCRAFMCDRAKLSYDTSVDSRDPNNLKMYSYCDKHAAGCKVYVPSKNALCGEPVTSLDYDSGKMICRGHLELIKGYVMSKSPNSIKPVLGKCQRCDEYKYLCMNAIWCNSCIKERALEISAELAELEREIMVAQKQIAPEGKDYVTAKSGDMSRWGEGLGIDIWYDGIFYEDANLLAWRADGGLGLNYMGASKGSQNQVLAGTNCFNIEYSCIDSALACFALALQEAGAELYVNQSKKLSVETYQLTTENGNDYTIPNLNGLESCILLENLANINPDLYIISESCVDMRNFATTAEEVVEFMENSLAYNSDGGEHTTRNTGKTVSYSVNGELKEGTLFVSYGKGDGTPLGNGGTGVYPPEYATYYAEGENVYRVSFKVDADGNYIASQPALYEFKGENGITTIFDLTDNVFNAVTRNFK